MNFVVTILFLAFFSACIVVPIFVQYVKQLRSYKQRWRKAVEIMEEVQVENERLIAERDDAVALAQSFQKVASRAEGIVDENSDLKERLNEFIRIGRVRRELQVDKERARLAKRRIEKLSQGYNRPPRSLSKAQQNAIKEMYR